MFFGHRAVFLLFEGIFVVRMFLWTCGLVGLWACGPAVGLWWACGGPVVGLWWACGGPVVLWGCGAVGLWACGGLWGPVGVE